MKFFAEFKYRISRLILPAGLFLCLFYTYYHMLTGNRGLMVWYNMQSQVEKLKIENVELQGKLEDLKLKVSRLDGENFDADYIEELIRRYLPMAYKNEKIVLGTDESSN